MDPMKQTMQTFDDGRGLQINTSNGYIVSIGIGGGHYCENHYKRFDAPRDATSTMEVAIMRHKDHPEYNSDRIGSCDFVCLPGDVAAYVPVSVMGDIILAVECNDWARVCFLCKESDADESKFPKKV